MDFLKKQNSILSSLNIKQQNDTEPVNYTPIFTGFGTVTGINFTWARKGANIEIVGTFTIGTHTAVEAQITLPIVGGVQLTTPTTIATSARGFISISNSSTVGLNEIIVLAEANKSYFVFAKQGPATKALGNQLMSVGTQATVHALIPIQGWSAFDLAVSSLLLSLPTSKENNFSAIVNSDGTLASKSSDWINSVVKNSTGNYTITFKSGVFTVAPACVVTPSQGNQYDRITATPTSTNVNIIMYQNGVLADLAFNIIAQKQSNDYSAPGVYAGNVSREKIVFLKDVKPYNIDGGASVVGLQTRQLNTIEGDSSIVTLASNQFTLQPGEYDTEAFGFAYVSLSSISMIWNVTLNQLALLGPGNYLNTAFNHLLPLPVSGILSPNVVTTYELRQYLSNNRATDGLGLAHDIVGYNNTYSQVKIRKLK
jgi:hypothetical protein